MPIICDVTQNGHLNGHAPTKAQPSPGPWKLAPLGEAPAGLHEVAYVTNTEGGMFNQVYAPKRDAFADVEEWRAENTANAHLIIAAPDLLAACEKVAQGVNWMTCDDFDKLNAAIAKARGEA